MSFGIPSMPVHDYVGTVLMGATPIFCFKELEPDWTPYNSWIKTLPLHERRRKLLAAFEYQCRLHKSDRTLRHA